MSSDLESKDLFFGETFANLSFVWFCCHLCAICGNICLALENTFSLTFLDGICSAGQSFPPRYRTAITKQGGAAQGLSRSYAYHSVDHPSCPHRRRPYSCTAEAAQYLLKRSSLPSSRLWRLPLCQLRTTGRSQRRTPLLRVNSADAAAVAALPHACSGCACLLWCSTSSDSARLSWAPLLLVHYIDAAADHLPLPLQFSTIRWKWGVLQPPISAFLGPQIHTLKHLYIRCCINYYAHTTLLSAWLARLQAPAHMAANKR